MNFCYKILFLSALILLLCSQVQAQKIVDTVCTDTKGVVYKVKPTPGSTYQWKVDTKGGNIISSANADSVIVDWKSTPGSYKISVVERNFKGCWGDTVTAFVIVGPELHLKIDGFKEICAGEPVLLEASGALSYEWSTGEKSPSIVVYPKKSGLYTVVGQGLCKTDTTSFFINVVKRPEASFALSTDTPKYGEPFSLIYKGKDKDVKWHVTGSPNITEDAEGYRFNEFGQQELTIVATNKLGCKDSITYYVYVNFEAKIYMPSAFTPDGNGLNDELKPVANGIKSFHMEVFNRWGQRMFETDDIDKGWDGTYKGEPVMDGQYMYVIKAQGIDKRWHYLDGTVILMY